MSCSINEFNLSFTRSCIANGSFNRNHAWIFRIVFWDKSLHREIMICKVEFLLIFLNQNPIDETILYQIMEYCFNLLYKHSLFIFYFDCCISNNFQRISTICNFISLGIIIKFEKCKPKSLLLIIVTAAPLSNSIFIYFPSTSIVHRNFFLSGVSWFQQCRILVYICNIPILIHVSLVWAILYYIICNCITIIRLFL